MMDATNNERLVRSAPGTAMGEYLRCYWHPIALSGEMEQADGAPIRVTVMGEDLIAFRDSNARVGLIEPHCAHRGANLFYGRNEECGLRCVYHGWKYDVDGQCVDMPNVPAGSAYHGKMSIKAYPTQEYGDIVWAYLGSRENMPEQPPQLEFGALPASHRYVSKRLQQCNWVQSMEGALDTAHFSFLHMPAPAHFANDNPSVAADEQRMRWLRNDPMPRFTILDHDVGFVIGGARRADNNELYWRITQFMLPTHSVTPSAMPEEIYFGYSWVPIDDESCWIYVYAWNPTRPITDVERARFDRGGFGQFAELDESFVARRNRSNDYLIDREQQKLVSFTGVEGVAEQDAMAQDSQGLIADRTREHLTPSDVAIVRFRRAMLDGAAALQDGAQPPAAAQRYANYALRGGGCIAAADLTFEQVMKQRFGSVAG